MTSKPITMSLIAVLVAATSCIEIDSPNISTDDLHFKSEARFVNLSRFGSATIKLEDVNISFGSLSAGEASDYKEINSGARSLKVIFPDSFWVNISSYKDTTLAQYDSTWIDTSIVLDIDTTIINDTTMVFDTTLVSVFDTTFFVFDIANIDTMTLVLATEKKTTIFIIGSRGSAPGVKTDRKYVNAEEHYTFDAPANLNANWTHSDSAIVRVLNGSPDFEEMTVSVVGDNSEFTADGILYGRASSYNMIFPGDYAITVAVNDSTVMADTLALLANKRYTVAIYDEVKEFEDD